MRAGVLRSHLVAVEPVVLRRAQAAVVSTAIAAALYLGAVSWVGRAGVGAALKMVSLPVILQLLALSLVNYGLRFARWHYYLHRLGSSVPLRHDLRIYIGGFALTTTPGKAGEMARTFWLRPYGVPATVSIAAFLSERLQDFLGVVLLSSLGATLYRHGEWVLALSAVLVLSAMIVLYVPAVSRRALTGMTAGSGWAGTLGRRIAEVMALTRGCFGARDFVLGLALGLAAWGAEACGFFLLLKALGAPVPLPTAVGIYSLAMLAGAISFMPGGLGGSEAAMILLLSACAVPAVLAVSATLLIRLTTLWFAVFLGILALSVRAGRPGLEASLAPAPPPAGMG